MAEVIQVWGDGTKGLWSFGKVVDIPKGYVEVPTGDAFLTRRIKALAKRVFVRMKKRSGGYSRAISIMAPKKIVEAARKEAEITEQARAKKRAVSAVYRTRREQNSRVEIKEMMLKMFPKMPPEEAGQIVDHAFMVSSGRVGRVSSVDLEDKITLAVRAHIRHTHTEYDMLLSQGWDRRDARDAVVGEIDVLLHKWRGGGQ